MTQEKDLPFEFGTRKSEYERVASFINHYEELDSGTEVEVYIGRPVYDHPPGVCFCIEGDMYPFTTDEARRIADICENSIREVPDPDTSEIKNIAKLVIYLREAADQADAEYGRKH